MRGSIVLGSALTAAVLTMVAAVISGIVAANEMSPTVGTVARSILVVGALALTTVAWRSVMDPADRPESLLLGLMGGWMLNASSWSGLSFIGRLFSDVPPVAIVIDLVAWSIVSLGLVAVLARVHSPAVR
jgi:hypothetical protein